MKSSVLFLRSLSLTVFRYRDRFKPMTTKPEIRLARWVKDSLQLPRGYLGKLLDHIEGAGLKYEGIDRRLKLSQIDVFFLERLRAYQSKALKVMVSHGCGTLAGPCGSGKTALAAALIARWKQPSLVLGHGKHQPGIRSLSFPSPRYHPFSVLSFPKGRIIIRVRTLSRL